MTNKQLSRMKINAVSEVAMHNANKWILQLYKSAIAFRDKWDENLPDVVRTSIKIFCSAFVASVARVRNIVFLAHKNKMLCKVMIDLNLRRFNKHTTFPRQFVSFVCGQNIFCMPRLL